jgi:hypothetical protein
MHYYNILNHSERKYEVISLKTIKFEIMKRTLALMILIFSVILGNAQTMPEAYISLLPNPPGGICSEGENDAKSAFFEKVREVQEKLNEEISRRKENIENHLEANEDKMKQNAMARTGVSPELMQQLMAIEKASKGTSGETKKAYDAQKKALADKMMQQSTNISMGEIDNLKKMDKAGKTAWAEAYATEKKAEVMADPKAYQQQNAANMKNYQLLQKQRQLSDSLGAQVAKFGKQIQEIENSQEAIAIQTQIDELESKLNRLYQQENRPNDNEIKSVSNSLRNLQIRYCNLQTPKYLDVLAKYKSFTQASLTPYFRLEKLTNQVNVSQTGVEISTEPGMMGLQSVSSYIHLLSDVYRYNHINSAYKYIGSE